ncbi:MAG: hypothetical protein ACKOAX_12420, partial [Candidatus Kapaibacterium sp.]
PSASWRVQDTARVTTHVAPNQVANRRAEIMTAKMNRSGGMAKLRGVDAPWIHHKKKRAKLMLCPFNRLDSDPKISQPS